MHTEGGGRFSRNVGCSVVCFILVVVGALNPRGKAGFAAGAGANATEG